MKLPIPIFLNDNVHYDIEITKPKGSVIADTKKVADSGDIFSAMRTFIIGCTESIGEISDSVSIKSLVSKMPYKSAEAVAIAIMLKFYPEDDGIEGVYYCPRCHAVNIAEYMELDGMILDTRDFISHLVTNYYDSPVPTFEIELTEPVVIKNLSNQEIVMTIETIEMGFPTIENCINAYRKYGDSDKVRMQYQMFVEAIVRINRENVDNKWKNAFGMHMFNNIADVKNDIGAITDKINACGLDPTVEKTCKECGRVWQPQVNTSNFFVSGLHV